jgi:3-methyladenine DNA glycosylase AlkD
MQEILAKLRSLGRPENVAGMARYGITGRAVLGVSVEPLRELARELEPNHTLAQQLWSTGIHEARLLAAFIDEPDKVTLGQMDRWARDFDNWAVCDGVCLHLFGRTPHAWGRARAWAGRREEFVRRAAFALMAVLAIHDKAAPDASFLGLLPAIEAAAADERNGVKKAVNWALRQIGKRNAALNKAAIGAAERIRAQGTPAARWIASDALRELRGAAVARRLRERGSRRLPARSAARRASVRRR